MNLRNTRESNIDKKYRELIFQYSLEDIKESKNTRVPKFDFLCPSALLEGKVVIKKQGALHCFGWRAEGVSGLVV